MDIHKKLLIDIDAFLSRHGMTPSTLGALSCAQPRLIFNLRTGCTLQMATYARLVSFMSEYDNRPFPIRRRGAKTKALLTNQQMRLRIQNGATLTEVAKEAGVCKQRVNQIVGNLTTKYKAMTEVRARILRKHSQTLTSEELADLLNTTETRIRAYQKYYGYTSHTEVTRTQLIDGVKEGHALGLSDPAIGKTLNINTQKARRIRIKLGLRPNFNGRRKLSKEATNE
jgi:hypothetical protein